MKWFLQSDMKQWPYTVLSVIHFDNYLIAAKLEIMPFLVAIVEYTATVINVVVVSQIIAMLRQGDA